MGKFTLDKMDKGGICFSRVGDVDLLRAVGIILMIMGHVGFGSDFDKWIHAFHMPIWFVISGYFLNPERSTYAYIFKRIKALLIPYIVFGVAYELLFSMQGGDQWKGIVFPNTIQIPLNGSLWFLPALFLANVAGFLMLKYLPKYLAYTAMVVIAVLGCYHFVTLPFSADSACVGLGFILIGILLRKYKCLLNMKLIFAWVILGIVSVLIFVNGYVNVRANQYANIPLFWLNAGMMTVALWNICIWIDKKIDLWFFKEIGKDSLLYVCCNQFVLCEFDKYLVNYFAGKMGSWTLCWMKIAVIVIICFCANRIMHRIAAGRRAGENGKEKEGFEC